MASQKKMHSSFMKEHRIGQRREKADPEAVKLTNHNVQSDMSIVKDAEVKEEVAVRLNIISRLLANIQKKMHSHLLEKSILEI